jgi:protein phosphatase
MLMSDGVEVDSYGSTDVGKVRKENQDQFLIAALHKVVEIQGTSIPGSYRKRFDSGARALLLMVADGVGGHAGGEEASSVTLDAVTSYVTNSMRCFYKLDDQLPSDLLQELASSVQRSHAAVLDRAQEDPERSGMATTLTMAHVLWPRVYTVQIGDSRCYHLRGDAFSQVTRDQTVVQLLVEEGTLSPSDAQQSPYSSVLSQAIGGGAPEVEPEISKVDLATGDTLMLCTDGLTRHLSDEEIAGKLRAAATAQEACEDLVVAALDAGGRDNVTVVVARFS